MSSTSYTGTTIISSEVNFGNPRQYDGLPDTPVEEIVWEPMTAFIEYRENVEFSFGGKTWFCSSGSTKIVTKDNPPDWRYWAVASPYIFGSCNSQLARSQDVWAKDHNSLEEAQEALVTAIRGGK